MEEPMSKKILIIDDASSIRQTVKFVLEDTGYEINEAEDGKDALNQLNGQSFDLIICDVNMPNMNGIEFLEAVKKDSAYEDHRFTPIIMLTTESGDDLKNRGKELGARAWLIKPFKPDQLIDAVKKILS
jgi:two-component system, chemotaxis family, chemotaxis protein CheY